MYVMPSRFEPWPQPDVQHALRNPTARAPHGRAHGTVISTDPNTLKNKTASGFVFSGDGEDACSRGARASISIRTPASGARSCVCGCGAILAGTGPLRLTSSSIVH